MSKLHVKHIMATIEKMFDNKIDLSDMVNKPDSEKRKIFLTRGLAAYSLYTLASIDVDVAVEAIVDGYNDNGIDAIHFDRKQRILWLIQSKWIEKGTGEPDNGEILKFTKGICDLIDLKLERFNDRITRKEKEIAEALDDPLVKIKIVIVFTGHGLSKHNQETIEDLMNELNDPSELATYRIFPLKEIHKSLIGSIDGKPITSDVALSDWGQIAEPYKAFYGLIDAADLAQWWIENRGRLFSDDIRNFIGLTDINREIIETLTNEPDNFWYFNNGVTVLCQNIQKKPIGGSDRKNGLFLCEGISIVNGAQTVGSIGSAFEDHPDKVNKAKVFIRFISLQDCPDNFGVRVTKATNTQNKIEKRDFVTLDPEQERLKTELALLGINYHYIRIDEKIIPDERNCTLEEATIALACYNDVDLAVQAKREIGKLWEDTTKEPYTNIFNRDQSVTKLWRTIQVLRYVNTTLKLKEQNSQGRERSTYIHGNRFILHLVLQKMPKEALLNHSFIFENFQSNDLPNLVEKITELTKNSLEETYPSSLVHQVFRNFTKCRDLKNLINQKMIN